MTQFLTRREVLRKLGIGSAALPLVWNLPSLCEGVRVKQARKRRLVIMFSPNGVVPPTFWPDKEGELKSFKPSLQPLEAFRQRTLVLHGVCDKIRGDGDNHMRGIGCLLTGVELLPGNIQGGSDTPAGWANGRSIDQEIADHLQGNPATHSRFGSLEFGVLVPNRADTWTRMVYAAREPPAGADQQSLPDVQSTLRPGQGPREPAERDGRSAGGAAQRRPAAERGGPAVAGRARHVRPRDGAGPPRPASGPPPSTPCRRWSRA